jgi:hypothetical protein
VYGQSAADRIPVGFDAVSHHRLLPTCPENVLVYTSVTAEVSFEPE